MEGRGGFRTGVVIGVLATLVVALAVGVVLLVTGGDDGTTTVITSTTTSAASTDGVDTSTAPDATSGTPTAPDATDCPDVADIGPTGADPADAVNVSVVAVDCDLATNVIKGYFPAVIGGGGDPSKGVAVQGFTCTETDASGTTHVECVENVGRISFDLG